MKTKTISLLLCLCVLLCIFPINGSAADFQVSYYSEDIYAGGTADLYAFIDTSNAQGYTFQWQVDLGLGSGSWSDLEDNGSYVGTDTDHLQLRTTTGEYADFNVVPFRCKVTHPDGTVRYTSSMYVNIFSTQKLIPNMQRWGYELYEPTLTNVSGFKTYDYENYTCSAYAGSNITITTGSKPLTNYAVLVNSEVDLTRQIFITENGHTTAVSDQTVYSPYTVGANAVTIELKLHATIGNYDLGDVDTKTIKLSTAKPTAVSTATTRSACSLLRYTYNESQKLASIPKGATVEILGKTGSYYQVFYNNYIGYIGTSLLSVSQPSYDPVIKNVDVVIDEPLAGKTPSFTCQILTDGCQLYKTEPITWLDTDTQRFLTSRDTFQEGHSYTLQIWVSASSGYKFQVDATYRPKLTGTINGNRPPYIHTAYEQDPEQVIELSYTFNNITATPPHSCVPVLVPEVSPTCTQSGRQAYFRCNCGKAYADTHGIQEVDLSTWGILPAKGHSPGDWRYNAAEHYRYCTECSEMLDNADHYGGTLTCTAKPVCTVCGFAYGYEEPDHKWSPTYLYQDKNGHAWICANCKDHSKIEPHDPGPAATATEPQTCRDCGYIITPAQNHTHKLTKVAAKAATCLEDGNLEYYTCDGCSEWFLDAKGTEYVDVKQDVVLEALGHFSDEWGYNETSHWGICHVCNAVMSDTKAPHEAFNAEGCCETCGYVQGMEIPEPTQETADQTQPAEETETAEVPEATTSAETAEPGQDSTVPKKDADGGIAPWVLYLLVGLGSLLICAAVTMLMVKKTKK